MVGSIFCLTELPAWSAYFTAHALLDVNLSTLHVSHERGSWEPYEKVSRGHTFPDTIQRITEEYERIQEGRPRILHQPTSI